MAVQVQQVEDLIDQCPLPGLLVSLEKLELRFAGVVQDYDLAVQDRLVAQLPECALATAASCSCGSSRM